MGARAVCILPSKCISIAARGAAQADGLTIAMGYCRTQTLACIAAVALSLAAMLVPIPPAFAELAAQVYDIRAVRVVNFIGSLYVDVGDQPGATAEVDGTPDMVADVGVHLDGDILVIARKGMIDHGDKPFDAADYPTVRLRVPVATALAIQGIDGIARIGDIAAPLSVDATTVDLVAGNVATATIDWSGSGRIELGDVSGPIVVRLGGSGDFIVGKAGAAKIEKRGSGDMVIGAVKGSFVAEVRGTGDVSVADVGTTTVEKHGSGNVRFGRVAGGLSYTSFGIGDAEVAAVDGPVLIETTSSGEVHIRDGRANPLKVVMREYGFFTMDGEAVNPDLTAEGASIVRINSYTGQLRAQGTGFFEVKRR